MRYRYDPRVAVAGLVLGAIILVGGLLTGNEAGGAIALAAIVTSTMVAYVRVPGSGGKPADRR